MNKKHHLLYQPLIDRNLERNTSYEVGPRIILSFLGP